MVENKKGKWHHVYASPNEVLQLQANVWLNFPY